MLRSIIIHSTSSCIMSSITTNYTKAIIESLTTTIPLIVSRYATVVAALVELVLMLLATYLRWLTRRLSCVVVASRRLLMWAARWRLCPVHRRSALVLLVVASPVHSASRCCWRRVLAEWGARASRLVPGGTTFSRLRARAGPRVWRRLHSSFTLGTV